MPLTRPNSPPAQFFPADLGFITWSPGDPALMFAGTAPTAGTLNMVKLVLRETATISSLSFYVQTAGAGLTNVGVAIYTAAGALLTSSVNANGATAAAFQATGVRTTTIAPQVLAAGTYYAAIWATGTTMPQLLRAAAGGSTYNAGSALPTLRFAVANTGLTTTAPATATQTGNAPAGFWAAAA